MFLSPDEKDPNDFEFPGKPVGGSGVIHEVARTPLQLVWAISEDGFARYVVHCCARYHEVVSFSKYLTYLLVTIYLMMVPRQGHIGATPYIPLATECHPTKPRRHELGHASCHGFWLLLSGGPRG